MKQHKLIDASNSGYPEEFLEYAFNIFRNREQYGKPLFDVFAQKFEVINGTLMLKISDNDNFDMEILEV